MQYSTNHSQSLYCSLSRPLRYMSLTLDEWGVSLVSVIPRIVLFNSGNAKLGLVLHELWNLYLLHVQEVYASIRIFFAKEFFSGKEFFTYTIKLSCIAKYN